MNITVTKSILAVVVALTLVTPQLFAEDINAEPGVTELGEPRFQETSTASKQVHEAIEKTKQDINQLQANTKNELDDMEEQRTVLLQKRNIARGKKVEKLDAQIEKLQQDMHDLKERSTNEQQRLQKQLNELQEEAKHKFHESQEKY